MTTPHASNSSSAGPMAGKGLPLRPWYVAYSLWPSARRRAERSHFYVAAIGLCDISSEVFERGQGAYPPGDTWGKVRIAHALGELIRATPPEDLVRGSVGTQSETGPRVTVTRPLSHLDTLIYILASLPFKDSTDKDLRELLRDLTAKKAVDFLAKMVCGALNERHEQLHEQVVHGIAQLAHDVALDRKATR